VDSSGEITSLLSAARRGDRTAESRLADRIYGELRRIAASHMRHERRDHTLQTTALVNEAYLRLIRGGEMDWQGRAHFFASASTIMRHILVDYARQRAAAKRPDGNFRVELHDLHAGKNPGIDQILILDEALSRLAEMDPRQARLVEMRYFAGLNEEEIAAAMGISVRTVKRDWRSARAWLQAQLEA
jgi:RNA polymerase sigma factor (TIGR02999 family)